jgi:hypothetical protein
VNFFPLVVLRIKPWALHMVGYTEPHPVHFFRITSLLRNNSHTIKFTLSKWTMKYHKYIQSCASIITIWFLEHTHHHHHFAQQKGPGPVSSYSTLLPPTLTPTPVPGSY